MRLNFLVVADTGLMTNDKNYDCYYLSNVSSTK